MWAFHKSTSLDKSLEPFFKKKKKTFRGNNEVIQNMKPQLYEHLQVAWKNVHGKEARLLLLDYQKARTRAGFTRAGAVANQQEPRRGALIWTGCGKELALSPCLRRPGFHFEVNATCPSIILFSELCCWFSSVTLVKAYDASVLWREHRNVMWKGSKKQFGTYKQGSKQTCLR